MKLKVLNKLKNLIQISKEFYLFLKYVKKTKELKEFNINF